MKSEAFLTFALAAFVAAVPTASLPRSVIRSMSDEPFSIMGMANQLANSPVASMFKRAPVDSKIIPSQVRKDAIRKQVRYGPYTMPAANERTMSTLFTNETGSLMIADLIDAICSDCVVLAGGATISHKDGSEANTTSGGVYNHHIIALNLGKTSPLIQCPGHTSPPSLPGVFVGGANGDTHQLFTSQDGQFKSGYYLAPNQTLFLQSELMSYNPSQQDIYITIEAEYLPGKKLDYYDVTTLPVTVTDCGSVFFSIPPEPYSKKGGILTVPGDGYILTMTGHMHDGGSSVDFVLNNKTICTSEAHYGTAPSGDGMSAGGSMGGMMMGSESSSGSTSDGASYPTITYMGVCKDPVAIKKGDQLQVNANFDLQKHPMRKAVTGESIDVMGIGVFNFAFPLGTHYPGVNA